MRLNASLAAPHKAVIPGPESEIRLHLALSARTLLRLLENGQLCAAEFRCLDRETHRCVRRLLMKSCVRRFQKGK